MSKRRPPNAFIGPVAVDTSQLVTHHTLKWATLVGDGLAGGAAGGEVDTLAVAAEGAAFPNAGPSLGRGARGEANDDQQRSHVNTQTQHFHCSLGQA
ncbi:MAG: hypothetical protein HY669_01985 [Chloroflexi bacterium]|nr:hypothetical protein [Chloroflexota bacterium]